ncbi:hypothetical protein JNUCC0626_20095 [Lentzea sp. JNUCC 0626]|uniref:hypothetical protein n=1 Tax=Lentzea sp. JNUCC 0626 TaxID=3367513 RepID=UPI0037494E2A
MLPRGLTNALTVLISLVWAGNVIVGFFRPELRDPLVNGIFAVVVGAIYALGRNDSGGNALSTVRRRIAAAIAGDDPEPAPDQAPPSAESEDRGPP